MSASVHSRPPLAHHQQQPSVEQVPPSESAQKQLQQYLDALIERLAPTSLLCIGISDTDGYLIASSTMPATTTASATDSTTGKGKPQRISTPPQQPLPLQVLYSHLHQIPLACQQSSKLSLGNATIITLHYSHYTLIVYNLTPIYVTFVVDYKGTANGDASTSSSSAASASGSGSSKAKNGTSSAYSSNLGLLHSIYGSVSGSLQSLRTSIQSQRDAAT